jgi:hypothetical protein
VKLQVWSPQSRDGLALLAPALARGTDLVWVSEGPSPPGVPHTSPADASPADLDLYDVADTPAHAFAWRAARERPGVLLLRDWAFPRLLAQEMARPDTHRAAVREMQRAYGDEGVIVARMVARGLGGDLLPAFFPLNDRLLETSLGVVALTEDTRRLAARRLGDERTIRLPIHLIPHLGAPHLRASDPVSPTEARRSLALPADGPVVASARPDPFRLASILRVAPRLREEFPGLRILLGEVDATIPDATLAPDLPTMAAAADVVVALDPLAPGGAAVGLAEAAAAGRPLVLTEDGSAAADFPEGTATFVTPGRLEEAELEAVIRHLLRHGDLRERLARLGHEAIRPATDIAGLADRLVSFLRDILDRKQSILDRVREARGREDALVALLSREVESDARALGLEGLDLGLHLLFEPLLRSAR